MARRYRRKRTMRRKMRRRRRRPRRIRTLLGKTAVCSHKLVVPTQLQVDTVGGLSIIQTLRANSAANPVVGSSVQPLGFAQMNALFDKNTVLGSKLTLTCLPSQNQHARAFYATLELANRFGSPSFNLAEVLSRRFARYCVYSPGDGGGWKPRVTSKCSVKKFFGVKDLRDNNELSAIGEGLPTQVVHWNIGMAPSHATSLQTCDAIIQVSYAVLYTQPITPPMS